MREETLRSSRNYYGRRAAYFDLYAQRRKRDIETPRELDFVEHAFRTHATRRVKDVLDVACGGGRHVVGLAQRGYRCTGRDLTPERIEAATARAKRARVSVGLGTGDATTLGFHNEFDAVLAPYILFLLPNDDDIQKCLRSVFRALRTGGIVVCNLFNPFTTGKNWLVEVLRHVPSVEDMKARGIRITDIDRAHKVDPVRGIVWMDETCFVEAPDGRHIFRDRGRVRLLTYWDLTRYLENAGFHNIECYPDWKIKPMKKPKAEQLVFVARK